MINVLKIRCLYALHEQIIHFLDAEMGKKNRNDSKSGEETQNDAVRYTIRVRKCWIRAWKPFAKARHLTNIVEFNVSHTLSIRTNHLFKYYLLDTIFMKWTLADAHTEMPFLANEEANIQN